MQSRELKGKATLVEIDRNRLSDMGSIPIASTICMKTCVNAWVFLFVPRKNESIVSNPFRISVDGLFDFSCMGVV